MTVAVRLRWLVEDLDVVMATYDQIIVKRSTGGIGGPYTEITDEDTRIDLQTGKTLYEYIDAQGLATYYYRVTWHDSTLVAPDDDQDPFLGDAATGMYCTVEDLRDEGITVTMLSDARATNKIMEWSRFIERVTNRYFEPRSRAIRVDTVESGALFVGAPIMRLDSLAFINGRGANYTEQEIQVRDIVVYNRHLTEGLVSPDDRDTPRIEFPVGSSWYAHLGINPIRWDSDFDNSRQGFRLTGVFGFTELDPDDSVGETSLASQIPLAYGRTPWAIRKAAMLLVVRDMPTLADFNLRDDFARRWMLTSEKTADQSYTRASPAATGTVGAWTGDAEIDSILSMYTSPVGRVRIP